MAGRALVKLPKFFPDRWVPSLSPRFASGSVDDVRDRFQPMYFSSRSGGGDDGGFDDDETTVADAATESPARNPRGRNGGRGGDGGRQRTIQFQPDDRYWTEYLRIALPIIGLILMLGLFWYWATLIIGDDGNNTDPVEETPPGMVQTSETTEEPATTAPTEPVQNTPEATEPTNSEEPTEESSDSEEPTEESTDEEPTEEPTDEEPTEEESSGEAEFASEDTVVISDDGVNMRSESNTSGEIVETLSAGDEFTVVEGPVEEDGYTWYFLTDGTTEGWVAADFIEAAE
jgi:hypothetical protein